MTEVRVLGPLEVRRSGEAVELRSARRGVVLAILCARVGATVPVGVLVEGLWGDDPPPQALATLQSHISRLRQILGKAAIETLPGAYRLNPDVTRIDIDQFEQARADANAAARHGRHAEAAQHLATALALWRGPAFGDLTDNVVLRPLAIRLEERRVTAGEDLAEARLAIGLGAPVIADLQGLCAEHPWRERPHLLLMRALAAHGRARDALEVGHVLRRRLADSAGLSVSAAVAQLEAEIARGETAVDRLLVTPSPAGSTCDDREPATNLSTGTARRRRRLPRPPTSFVGREADVAAVERALQRSSVVTVCGVGGVGKTRLAIEVGAKAEAYDDVWFSSLAPVGADGVVHAVARAVGASPRRDQSPLDAALERIGGRRSLLVLDNCEHVLDAAARLVSTLVGVEPHLRILATSRQPLDVTGEQVVEVRPLASCDRPGTTSGGDPPAVALFAQRAQAVRPDFVVDAGNVDAVVDICRRLDGLPLAIEMAGARMRSMTPGDLARRLDERLRVLRGRRDAQQAHHRSLESLLGWSYDLCADGERRVLARASAFGGSFDLDAAIVVCGLDDVDPGDVADHLDALVDRSLVVAEHDQVRTRYRLLETVRTFAAARLRPDEEAQVCRAHANHFIAWAHCCRRRLAGPDEPLAVAEMDRELDNLRAVHQWALRAGRSDLVSALLDAVFEFALWRDRLECYDWARAAVERFPSDDPNLAGAFAYLALSAPVGTAQHADALRHALALYEQRPGDADRCWPLRCAVATDQPFDVRPAVERSLTMDLALADQDGRGLVATMLLCLYSNTLLALQDRSAARRLIDDLTDRASTLRAPTALALALFAHANLAPTSEPGRAEALLEAALRHASTADSRRLAAPIFAALAEVRARHADLGSAIEWLVERWEAGEGRANGVAPETILTYLMAMCRRAGAAQEAATLLGAVEARRGNRIASFAERQELSMARAALGRRIGVEAVEPAMSVGRALTDEGVASLARRVARATAAELPSATAPGLQSGKSAGE